MLIEFLKRNTWKTTSIIKYRRWIGGNEQKRITNSQVDFDFCLNGVVLIWSSCLKWIVRLKFIFWFVNHVYNFMAQCVKVVNVRKMRIFRRDLSVNRFQWADRYTNIQDSQCLICVLKINYVGLKRNANMF